MLYIHKYKDVIYSISTTLLFFTALLFVNLLFVRLLNLFLNTHNQQVTI